MFTEFDRLAMTRALALAERGLDTTHPNPRVGCVIAKGDRIIGEGFHERAGEPHAEVMALRSAKEPVAGATAYVTLEPCSHHGRTPPCVNALIEARIARVVFAVQDPNPRVSGQGADALLRAGITVEAGLMQNEATELNIGFMKRMKEGLPWVRVKLAMSLDGRTALANGASQWITGEPARADVQRWRARCSAVMTGVGTVLADDPQLNVRLAGFKGRQPLRVVLDARLRSPVGAKLFAGVGGVGSAGAGAAGAGVAPAGGAAVKPGAIASGVGAASSGAAGGNGASGGTSAARAPTAAAAAGVAAAAAVTGGDVVIFTAADGGLSAAAAAAAVDSSKLPDDMAELVNAFEMSPNSVAARTDDVAGSVSVKADARTSASASAGASTKATTATAPAAVPGAVMDLTASAAPAASKAAATGLGVPTGTAADLTRGAAPPIKSADPAPAGAPSLSHVKSADTAPTGMPGASPVKSADPAPTSAAPAANWSVRTPAAEGAATSATAAGAPGVLPPVVAAAGDVAGVAPTSDDATWAGAALSGAIPVKPEVDAVSDGATPSSAPTTAASVNDASPPPPVTPVAGSATPGSEAALRARAALLANATIGDTVLISNPVAAAAPSGANITASADAPAAASAGASSGITTVTRPTVAPTSTTGGPAHSVTVGPATGSVPAKPAVKQDSAAAFQGRRAALAAKGVRIEEVPSDDGFLDLFAVLKKLGEMEVNEVLVEAGPTLAGQLLTTFFVDELLLYVAPKLLGPQGRPLVNLPELQSLQDAWGFSLFDAKRFGDDLRLRMRPK